MLLSQHMLKLEQHVRMDWSKADMQTGDLYILLLLSWFPKHGVHTSTISLTVLH